jgi:hypothetical protein
VRCYDRDPDLFAVDDVAQRGRFAQGYAAAGRTVRIANVPAENSEAHGRLLKGDYYANQFSVGLADPAEAARRAAESAAQRSLPIHVRAGLCETLAAESSLTGMPSTRAQTVDGARATRRAGVQPDLPGACSDRVLYWGSGTTPRLWQVAIAGRPAERREAEGRAGRRPAAREAELSVTEFAPHKCSIHDPGRQASWGCP